MRLTFRSYINYQTELEADAREALPYSFNSCTKPLGSLRQSVYSCLTCNPPPNDPSASYSPAGVCYACSISCHGDHDLVELFSMRDFECDCGTTRLPKTSACSLRSNNETGQTGGVHSENAKEGNKYNHNYRNRFCACGELYAAHKQVGTMFQCLGLGSTEEGGCGEDWWHPECVMGISKDWRTSMSAKPQTHQQEAHVNGDAHLNDANSAVVEGHAEERRADVEDNEDDLPPGFPAEEEFEHFLCYKCVAAFPWIKRYAGTPGFLPAVEKKGTEDANIDVSIPEPAIGLSEIERLPVAPSPHARKRSFDQAELDAKSELEPAPKRAKEDIDAPGQAKTETECKYDALPPAPLSKMSMFLKENFREHLCRCSSCFPRLQPHPQLLDEEDTYEPPISHSEAGGDGSAHSAGTRSLLDRGEAAFSNMDRVRAIEGAMAYNHMKDHVKTFLKPFADSGKAVSAEDVKKYFEKLRGDEQAMREAQVGRGGDGNDNGDNRREQSGY